ncbi:MAG: arabinosyltransferase domain-containing protein, partial [Pseudonocardiaceae bacterium]
PALWRLVRGRSITATLARAACLVAPGTIAALAGFADGSLRDFRLSQQIFLGIQDQESWYSEYARYGLLLAQIAMGSYAKRAAVLVALVALVWFVAVWSAARARDVAVPQRLALAGWSLGLGFLLLWPTPSKWTHHFGALAGIGPAFLALFLVFAPVLVFQVARGRRLPAAVVGVAVVSGVLTVALAGHGPNDWPYTWNFGMPNPSVPPFVGSVRFDQPLWWLLLVVIVAAVLVLWYHLRAPRWRRHAVVVAVPVLVVAFFVATLGYLLGTFGIAAARTWDTYSLGAANLQDPLATECRASRAVEVLDERAATPLRTVGARPTAPGPVFAEGAGWFEGTPPPVAVGEAAAAQVWGSFIPRAGTNRWDENTGRWASPWYEIPSGITGGELAVLVAGRLGGGNSLTVEYAGAAGSRPLSSDPTLTPPEPVTSTAWRTVVLPGQHRPAGADAVRIVAEDATTDVGGWFAFTAPAVHPYVPLGQYVAGSAPVGLSWQFGFTFPCLRQPRQRDGITEPVSYAVLWGDGPLGGLEDGSWQKFRGGAFARIPIVKPVFQPASRFRDFPEQRWIEVYRFPSDLAPDAYALSRRRDTVAGG